MDAVVVAVISYFVFLIFGLPAPYILAAIVGITNVIPILGPFIGGIPCAVLVLLMDPSKTILFIILVLIIQQIDGNIICPKILGGKIDISPLTVLISIVIMGGLFGIPGMILGVPCFAVVIHLIQNKVINSLRNKGLESSIEHYYVGHVEDILDVDDNSDKLIVKFFNWIANICKKVWSAISGFFKKIFKKKEK